MSKSTSAATVSKPSRPKDCPLFAHATRRWAKKVRGKLAYFGPWDDLDGALKRWVAQKDNLLAGLPVDDGKPGKLTVRELVNQFMNHRRGKMEAGRMTRRAHADYKAVGDKLADVLGRDRHVEALRPTDFDRLRSIVSKGELGKGVGPHAIKNFVVRAKSFFKFAYDRQLIDRPVNFADSFDVPEKMEFRKARNERGLRMFTSDELRKIIKAAPQPIKSMILLGANCGLGNSDVGQMRLSHVDLVAGVLNYPRPKTQVARKAYLWPETIKEIKAWLKKRPTPKNPADADLVFVTKYGNSWHTDTVDSPISKELRKLLKAIGILRLGVNFYALRHGFETIAGQTRDQPAVDRIMGHAEKSNDMAAIYREEAGDDTMDDRLKSVVKHVRKWVFPPKKEPAKRKVAKAKRAAKPT